MTNHDEAAGSSGPGDTSGSGCDGREPAVHSGHDPSVGLPGELQVTLRTPAELADALPYLLGYRPEDSAVLVALHDGEKRGGFGGRARLGIPAHPDDWPSVAERLAHGLVTGSERRGSRPGHMIAYLVQEPANGETGRDVMERLRPLAQLLRTACGRLDVPVVEALCISDGRYWSYCCPSPGCCPPQGRPMGLPGTSVLAAAATYAGLQVRGSLKEFRARLTPRETTAALDQEAALDAASLALVPRILGEGTREEVAARTLELAELVMARFAEAPSVSGTLSADLRDDDLLAHDEAAALILGLQDRTTRDRAAEWMEGAEALLALRLWRALARRCVASYGEHAAAPLTLAGWVAWSTGDELEAREAFAMALGADPDYLFARLLHQACNEGLDPESVRRCLRSERAGRGTQESDEAAGAGETADGTGETTEGRPVTTPPGGAAPPLAGPARSTDPERVEGSDRPAGARPVSGGDRPAHRSADIPTTAEAPHRRPADGPGRGGGPRRRAEAATSGFTRPARPTRPGRPAPHRRPARPARPGIRRGGAGRRADEEGT
ncbi:DUF4192 family protein [Streptomyces sp. NPDC007264]|uniref:DUF4192 domain-containing protein n=1 Tax=Streptomyces sp. NPDC007264 TaxID=3364777 RepID=UPI0036DE962E